MRDREDDFDLCAARMIVVAPMGRAAQIVSSERFDQIQSDIGILIDRKIRRKAWTVVDDAQHVGIGNTTKIYIGALCAMFARIQNKFVRN